MADITNVFNAIWPLFAHICLYLMPMVKGDYCEFGLCDKEQYCCGNNKCCNKTLDLWFFWAAIILVLFALAITAGIGHSRYKSRRARTNLQYSPVPTHPTDDVAANS